MTRSWSFSTCPQRCTRHRAGLRLSVQPHSRMLRYRGCTSAFRQLSHPTTSARALCFAMPPRKSVQQQQAAARSDGRTAIALSNAEVARRLAAPSSFPRREPLPAWAVPSSSGNAGSARSFASTTASKSSSTSSQSKQKPEPQDADQMARRLTRFYTSNFERRPVITLCVTNSILSTIGDTCAQLIPILALVGGADVPGWDFARTLRFAVFGFSLGPMIEKWNRFLEYRFPLRPVEQVFAEKKPEMPDPDSPAFMDGLKKMAEKEGFKVNVERGDSQQGQQYASHGLRVPQDGPHRRSSSRAQPSGEKGGSAEFIIDPQHVAMPNTGQPGQISVAALFKRVAADQLFMAPLGLAVFISTMAVLEGLEWDDVVDRYKKMYLPILLINWQIWPIVQLINFRYLPLRYRVPFSASLGVLWTVFLSFKQAKATKA